MTKEEKSARDVLLEYVRYHATKLHRLYYSSIDKLKLKFFVGERSGFRKDPRIVRLLKNLDSKKIDYEIIDTDKISIQELEKHYRAAAHLALTEKWFKVREIFDGLAGFGKRIPALLVYRKDGDFLIDVYPKESSFDHFAPIFINSIERFLRFLSKLAELRGRKSIVSRSELETIVTEAWREGGPQSNRKYWDRQAFFED